MMSHYKNITTAERKGAPYEPRCSMRSNHLPAVPLLRALLGVLHRPAANVARSFKRPSRGHTSAGNGESRRAQTSWCRRQRLPFAGGAQRGILHTILHGKHVSIYLAMLGRSLPPQLGKKRSVVY